MKPQHLVSFLLLTALAEAGAEDRTSTGVMWQAANARDGVRTTATEEISPGSELLCAVEASKRSWCTFYCYIDDVCRLYDIVFPPSIFPSTVNCKTNFPSRSVCSSPFAVIPMLEDLGCIYMSLTKRRWNESREDCYTYGADLFVASTPEQFFSLKNHFYANNLRNYKWVGVIARAWVDGRAAVDVWNSGEPNGPIDATMCGIMQPGNTMDDTYCSSAVEYVCQANRTTT
ncbi:uncharacterized protein LOC119594937 [Penaeus monodon]|uniref:uncharacterized protein LOC119594937 n=1 Tax=Penaeus monodon TaxID=6687 RepID=UPI0018A7C665|nr:uncharacterized protein LOC119594937 [Penaeus monodon]